MAAEIVKKWKEVISSDSRQLVCKLGLYYLIYFQQIM